MIKLTFSIDSDAGGVVRINDVFNRSVVIGPVAIQIRNLRGGNRRQAIL